MNKTEYYTLQYAITLLRCLKDLSDDYELPPCDVIDAACQLFKNGDIIADVYPKSSNIPPKDDDSEQDIIEDVFLTRAEIEAHFEDKFDFSYRLTPQGGAKWESVANPNWNHCIRVGDRDREFPLVNFICGQKQIIEKALALSSFPSFDQYSYVPGTEIWEVVEPWQATYWKILPKGYEIIAERWSNYCLLWGEDSHMTWVNSDFMESRFEAERWYINTFYRWYTRPFPLPFE